jgi:phosphoserine phosphatase RsbU/P
MTFLTKRPAFTRLLLCLLSIALLTISVITFYRAASSPTDENLFISSPSLVTIAVPVEAGLAEIRPRAGSAMPEELKRRTASGIRPGDMIVQVDKRPTRTLASYEQVLGALSGDSTNVRVFRPALDALLTFRVATNALAKGLAVSLPSSVVVVAVTPGGASDRAGMNVGDMITRINGQGFRDAQGADLLLRRGVSGKASTYDIVREGQSITLQVTLAEFGFALSLLVFCLSGLVYVGAGLFIALKRPAISAALTMGLWFILIGFFISVGAVKAEPDPTPFTILRDILKIYGAYLGTAFAFHTTLLFPWERPRALKEKWLLPLLYGLALLSPLTGFSSNQVLPIFFLFVYLILGSVLTFVFREKLTPQQKRVVRPFKLAGLIAGAGSAIVIVALILLGQTGQFGFTGLLLIVIPITYLFTIGHYRLLDLDLRVRRNVQYTLLSMLWGAIVALLLFRLFLAIPGVSIPVPGVTVTGFSVEIDSHPKSPDQQEFLQRLGVMILAVGVWYLLWRLRAGGQQVIDRKYYRTRFDYRRAASELAEVLASKLSMNDIATGIVETLVDLLKLKRAGLLVFRDGLTSCCHAVCGVETEIWEKFVGSTNGDLAKSLAAAGRVSRVDQLPVGPRVQVQALGFQHAVPVRSKDRLVGVLLIGEKMSEAPHGAEDLTFLGDVAKQVSVSIDNAFLYEHLAEKDRLRHELDIARRIQMSSLPSTTPHIQGMEIAGISLPAMEVGGDFFDYLQGKHGDLMIVVGDVSGKGTSAALYMSKVQGILRALHGFTPQPHDLFLRANRLLCNDLEKSSFVTALGALFHVQARRMTFVRAGHLPLLHYRAVLATVERIVPRGLGLGLNDAGIFARELEEHTREYASGDIVVFATDGVTEARNAAGDEYGEDRLTAAVARANTATAEGIRDLIIEDLRVFTAGADQHDDQTLVIVRIL